MQIHFSYHNVPRTSPMDKVIQTHIQKLEKLLSRFTPDLVHLHGTLESNGVHQNTVCSLNLALPTGQLHASQQGSNLMTDLQTCFDHLEEQVKKHKQALRREESWRRDRIKPAKSPRSET